MNKPCIICVCVCARACQRLMFLPHLSLEELPVRAQSLNTISTKLTEQKTRVFSSRVNEPRARMGKAHLFDEQVLAVVMTSGVQQVYRFHCC